LGNRGESGQQAFARPGGYGKLSFNGRLETLNCPVLLTRSLKDAFIPDLGDQQLKMFRQIPGSTSFCAMTVPIL